MPAYIGVNGKAKAIAKVYKGDSNGKAQLIWGPRGIVKYTGNIVDLSVGRYWIEATTVGNYALFGGGVSGYNNNYTYHSTVDAYDTSLTRTTSTSLSKGRDMFAATTVGNYALFGGGSTNDTYYSTVDAYNTSLTRTTATSLSKGRNVLSATTVGDHALFGGGFGNTSRGGKNYLSTVDAYNTSLTRTTATALSAARYKMSATTVGNYALFSGGSSSSVFAEIYDSSLTKISNSYKFSKISFGMMAASIENYAIFAGGTTSSRIPPSASDQYSDAIAFNENLTNVSIKSLSSPRWNSAATNINKKYAIFSGDGDSNITSIDAYDSELTLTTINSAFYNHCLNSVGTSINNYALLAGSSSNSGWKRVIVFDINLVKSIAPDLEDIGYYISATSDTEKNMQYSRVDLNIME